MNTIKHIFGDNILLLILEYYLSGFYSGKDQPIEMGRRRPSGDEEFNPIDEVAQRRRKRKSRNRKARRKENLKRSKASVKKTNSKRTKDQ